MTTNDYLDEGTKIYNFHSEARKYFSNIQYPSMAELITWFQVEYKDLAMAMKNSDHASEEGYPNAYHVEGSVWTHTMMVCHEARYDHKVNKLAALFHDIGKPNAREVFPIDAPKPSMNGEERENTHENISDGRKFKTHFVGHEGLSFWISIDPLYRLKYLGILNHEEIEEILHIISLHGVVFNRIKDGKEFKPEQVVNMFNDIAKYKRFINHTKHDSLGRFYQISSGTRNDYASYLGTELYSENTFHAHAKENLTDVTKPTVHVLVGLPGSGKSTFIENNLSNEVVISKDNVIMEMGRELGIFEYSDVYRTLTPEQHDEAYKETINRFNLSVKNKEDIVVDLTNMSRKSRNKWLHALGNKYNTKAWVFITGQLQLASRNFLRAQTENKVIPEHVYTNMMKTFLVPTLFEFNEIEYVFQG